MRKQKHHSTAAVSLLQAISHMVTVALAKVKKSNIKKKGEKKRLGSQTVCGNSQGPEAVYFRT